VGNPKSCALVHRVVAALRKHARFPCEVVSDLLTYER
jgi:hypothetical protein